MAISVEKRAAIVELETEANLMAPMRYATIAIPICLLYLKEGFLLLSGIWLGTLTVSRFVSMESKVEI